MMQPQFEIRFDTERHRKLLDGIMRRYQYSRNKMSERYDRWRELEELDLAYIKETEGDRLRKGKRKDGKPQYTTIEVPYSYAIKQSAHMYMSSVFLGRMPVHQFSGTNAASQGNETAVEALINYQVMNGGALAPYYILFEDILKYGVGVIGTYWDIEEHYVSEIKEKQAMYLGLIPIPGKTQKVRETRKIVGYNGNRIYNTSPYDWFPDPRVPMNRFQDGEFCARRTTAAWTTILERKHAGRYFNIDALSYNKSTNRLDSDSSNESSQQIKMPDNFETGEIVFDDKVTNTHLLEFYWKLVPSDWGLGSSTHPEKWVFTVAGGAIIIGAQPLGLNHNKFPFDVMDTDFNGYSLHKRSLLEVSEPLNRVMTWLINAHFHNVRKVLNDQLVVDPSRLVMKDVTDPNAGRLIRLKPEAYGTDPKAAIHQLAVVDITRSHLADTNVIADLLQRATGVMDNVMGAIDTGGRRSATEYRQANAASINRLKTMAEYIGATGFQPHATKLLQTTQQLFDRELELRIAGNLMQNPGGMLLVTPETIAGMYDYVAVDGSMPIDRNAQVMVWTQMLQQMAQFPQLLGRYDFGRIFDYLMKTMGVQNLNSFQVNVVPDGQLAAQAQAGNVVPMRGGASGPSAGGPGTPGATKGAAYAPGMGPVAPPS